MKRNLKMGMMVVALMGAVASFGAMAANEGSWEYKNGDWKCSGGSFCAGNPGGTGGTGGVGYGGTGVGVGVAGAAAGASATIAGGNGAGGVGGAAVTTSGPAVTLGGTANTTGGTVGAQTANNTNSGLNGSVKDSGNSTNVVITSVDTKGTVGNVSSTGGSSSVGNVSTGASTATVGNVGSTQGISGSGNSTIQSGAVVVNMQDADAERARSENDLAIAAVQASAALETAKIEAAARVEAARLAQKVKNTPSVNGPELTSSNDTCMGSTSGSANGPGIGIGFGTTWTEANCVMLKNSRELWNMGMKAASLALMCNDKLNREALELTGYECPQTTKAKQAAAPAAAAQANGEPTDPFVRRRMGLSELASAK